MSTKTNTKLVGGMQIEKMTPASFSPERIGRFPDRLLAVIAGRSVRAFARDSGVKETTLRHYLSGATTPNLKSLVRLATAGDVNPRWLAFEDGPMRGESGDLISDVLSDQQDSLNAWLNEAPTNDRLLLQFLIERLFPDYLEWRARNSAQAHDNKEEKQIRGGGNLRADPDKTPKSR